VIKKTSLIEGMEVRQEFTSPLIFLHDFFGTSPVEPKATRHGTQEYRTYKKKIVSEGKTTKWGAISTGVEKQRIADEKFKMYNIRGRM
jgi:hypothetical protein